MFKRNLLFFLLCVQIPLPTLHAAAVQEAVSFPNEDDLPRLQHIIQVDQKEIEDIRQLATENITTEERDAYLAHDNAILDKKDKEDEEAFASLLEGSFFKEAVEGKIIYTLSRVMAASQCLRISQKDEFKDLMESHKANPSQQAKVRKNCFIGDPSFQRAITEVKRCLRLGWGPLKDENTADWLDVFLLHSIRIDE